MLKGKLSHSAMSKASGFAEWLFKVADLQKCLITFFFTVAVTKMLHVEEIIN